MTEDDIDLVEFCFWCPDCLEPAEICRCAWDAQDEIEWDGGDW